MSNMTCSAHLQMRQVVAGSVLGPSTTATGARSAAVLLGSTNTSQLSSLVVMSQAKELAVGDTAALQQLQQGLDQLQSNHWLQSDLAPPDMPGTAADESLPAAAMPQNAAHYIAASEVTAAAPEYTSPSASSPQQFSSQTKSPDQQPSRTASPQPSLAADRADPSGDPYQGPAGADDPWDGNSPWYDAEASPRNLAGSSDSDWAGEAYQQDVLEQQSPHVAGGAAQDDSLPTTAGPWEASEPNTPSKLSKLTCGLTPCRDWHNSI